MLRSITEVTTLTLETKPMTRTANDVSPACPVCRSGRTRLFFQQLDVPCQDGMIWPTRQAAIDATRGDIELTYCADCAHIFNRRFDPSKLVLDAGYNISLHHSPTYRKFIDDLTSGLVDRHDLHGKTVLEIGCGKADFLRGITIPYGNRGIGFDPTFVDDNLTDDERRSIAVHRRFYTAADQGHVADFVTFRSMLQYVTKPREFLDSFRGSVAKPHGIIYAEVPNSAHTFEQLCIWNIVYEHGCFYSKWSLARLFEEMGYPVQDCFACFVEDQNLGVEAGVAASPTRRFHIDPAGVEAFGRAIERFIVEHERKTAEWRAVLGGLKAAGKRVAMWGAGARAISFCCLFDISDTRVPYVVDINPYRQGKFLPRTLQQVVAPEHLLADQPDVVIITNSGYASEIRAQIATMGLKCETMVM